MNIGLNTCGEIVDRLIVVLKYRMKFETWSMDVTKYLCGLRNYVVSVSQWSLRQGLL